MTKAEILEHSTPFQVLRITYSSVEKDLLHKLLCDFMVSCSCLFFHRTEANNYSIINDEIPTFAELLNHGFLEYDNIRQHFTLSL